MGEILAGIVMGILGIVSLAGAGLQFRCRGPVWTTEYLVSSPEEKKRLRTKQEYYFTAIGYLWIGLLILLVLVYTVSSLSGFLYGAFAAAGFFAVHILYGIFRAIKKSTERKSSKKERK